MLILTFLLWLASYSQDVGFDNVLGLENITIDNVEYNIDKQNTYMQMAESQTIELPKSVLLKNVPFTAQAPFGDWQDKRQGYGCEEANLVMSMHWAKNQPLTPDIALQEILDLTDFEVSILNEHHDLSLADTFRTLREFYKYDNAFIKYDIGINDIKEELAKGNMVIVPINGQAVNNPNYNALGPAYHQISVIGYDDTTQTFITHDPGTRQGANYKYTYQIIENALRDYTTGYKNTSPLEQTSMLIIQPN